MSTDPEVGDDAAVERLDVAPGERVLAPSPTVRARERLPAEPGGDLLVVSAASPDDVERSLARRGVDAGRAGMIPIGDADRTADGAAVDLWTGNPVAPDDVEELRDAVLRPLRTLPPGGWVLFESVEALFLFGDVDRVQALLDDVAETARVRGLRTVLSVAPDPLDDATYAGLAERFDRVLTVE